MDISVRTIGEVHSVQMGNFGLELTVEEAAELRRILDGVLHNAPKAETEAEGGAAQRTRVIEEGELQLQFTVGQFFWFLSREDSEDLFQVLDDLVTNRN